MTEDYKGPGWTCLADAKPPTGATCEWVCDSFRVERGVGTWYEQDRPCVSGFRSEGGLFGAPPQNLWWRLECNHAPEVRTRKADVSQLSKAEPEQIATAYISTSGAARFLDPSLGEPWKEQADG
jgi:hypothetical protein